MRVIVVIKKDKETIDNETVDYTKQLLNAIIIETSFIHLQYVLVQDI